MIAAVVPAKRLLEAKSRLSPHLPPEERAGLMCALLQRTITALQESGVVDFLALATAEAGLAGQLGAAWLPDQGSLNASLRHAAGWASDSGAAALLIVPGDLPLITSSAVRTFIAAAGTGRGIALTSTQDGGTGALLLTPPTVISPAFGAASFARHCRIAADRDVPAQVLRSPALSFDLDTIEDLHAVRAQTDSYRMPPGRPGEESA